MWRAHKDNSDLYLQICNLNKFTSKYISNGVFVHLQYSGYVMSLIYSMLP